jgi:hypothetical protein
MADEPEVTTVNIDDITGLDDAPVVERSSFPDPILSIPKEKLEAFSIWLDEWYFTLKSSHDAKLDEWAYQERQYRARSEGPQTVPFVGACGDVVPVSAMAVDPVHARLDTGIFKADPVFVLKPLKKGVTNFTQSLSNWIEYYQKHKLELRRVVSPRLLEMTKHGTMVLKTVYEHVHYPVMTYDKEWNVVKKDVTRFRGPKVYGISLADFLFPPGYQHLQDCPIVFERQHYFPTELMVAQKSGKLANVKKVIDQKQVIRDALEQERQDSANHQEVGPEYRDQIEVFEVWCDYDINGDGLPERLVATYHVPTRTFLQLRYNWYFHQHKPYTVVPYSITNDSLYGIGIGEMSSFFQDAQTAWHRMATDNTYLANIRMFVAKKESGIEDIPKLYCGRTFFVDDPKNDFIPFQAAEIYPSTLQERQNLFGLTEKRTGISDYLTGRESPIVGSRATATATTALIQEGTRRVEEVLENVRIGLAEVLQFCIYIWIQYGLDDVDDLVFGDDQIASDLKSFFDTVNENNIQGALAIDLSATDAANNRGLQQQMQLTLIRVMMEYLDKLVQAGQTALAAVQQGQPEMTQLISDVMTSARNMFRDLLNKYDIRNPDDYLPELEKYLDAAVANAQQGNPPGQPNVLTGAPNTPGAATSGDALARLAGAGPAPVGNLGGIIPGLQSPGGSNGLP